MKKSLTDLLKETIDIPPDIDRLLEYLKKGIDLDEKFILSINLGISRLLSQVKEATIQIQQDPQKVLVEPPKAIPMVHTAKAITLKVPSHHQGLARAQTFSTKAENIQRKKLIQPCLNDDSKIFQLQPCLNPDKKVRLTPSRFQDALIREIPSIKSIEYSVWNEKPLATWSRKDKGDLFYLDLYLTEEEPNKKYFCITASRIQGFFINSSTREIFDGNVDLDAMLHTDLGQLLSKKRGQVFSREFLAGAEPFDIDPYRLAELDKLLLGISPGFKDVELSEEVTPSVFLPEKTPSLQPEKTPKKVTSSVLPPEKTPKKVTSVLPPEKTPSLTTGEEKKVKIIPNVPLNNKIETPDALDEFFQENFQDLKLDQLDKKPQVDDNENVESMDELDALVYKKYTQFQKVKYFPVKFYVVLSDAVKQELVEIESQKKFILALQEFINRFSTKSPLSLELYTSTEKPAFPPRYIYLTKADKNLIHDMIATRKPLEKNFESIRILLTDKDFQYDSTNNQAFQNAFYTYREFLEIFLKTTLSTHKGRPTEDKTLTTGPEYRIDTDYKANIDICKQLWKGISTIFQNQRVLYISFDPSMYLRNKSRREDFVQNFQTRLVSAVPETEAVHYELLGYQEYPGDIQVNRQWIYFTMELNILDQKPHVPHRHTIELNKIPFEQNGILLLENDQENNKTLEEIGKLIMGKTTPLPTNQHYKLFLI
jgi:hypothetical protein